MIANRHDRTLRKCHGFSLIELMVALVITLILIGGIGQIFLSSKKSFTIQNSLGRQQENGRYATDTIAQDIRRAGYWGGNADVTEITGTEGTEIATETCATDNNDWGRMLDQRIYGIDEADTTGTTTGNYACINDGNGYLQGDVLVVRFAAPWIIGDLTTPSIQNNGRLYIRSALTISENAGKVFMGQDETKDENQMTPGATASPSERESELIARAYYIGPSGQDCNGASVPSLYRESLNNNGEPQAEEIAYGVEQLQFQYGLDTDGNDSVDSWVNAGENGILDTLVAWEQVIASRFWLLTRAECPETGYTNTVPYTMAGATTTFNDGYRRQLYTSTVKLRNL